MPLLHGVVVDVVHVSGEIALAPLTAGDYLLEISVTSGSLVRKELAAFRIVP